MATLNRSAVVVKPKQPFLDWLHAADPSSQDLVVRIRIQNHRHPSWTVDIKAFGVVVRIEQVWAPHDFNFRMARRLGGISGDCQRQISQKPTSSPEQFPARL